MAPGRRILLGIGGSIAAVKSPELVRILADKGFDVTCVLTSGGAQFASSLALATFSGKPVLTQMFDNDSYRLPHLRLAEESELMLIAPASATLMSHCANGNAEDMVSLIYLATRAPVVMAPAMHPTMWEHPATQHNVKLLRERGVIFSGPYIGPLADKTRGEGRMSEPEEILQTVENVFKKK